MYLCSKKQRKEKNLENEKFSMRDVLPLLAEMSQRGVEKLGVEICRGSSHEAQTHLSDICSDSYSGQLV